MRSGTLHVQVVGKRDERLTSFLDGLASVTEVSVRSSDGPAPVGERHIIVVNGARQAGRVSNRPPTSPVWVLADPRDVRAVERGSARAGRRLSEAAAVICPDLEVVDRIERRLPEVVGRTVAISPAATAVDRRILHLLVDRIPAPGRFAKNVVIAGHDFKFVDGLERALVGAGSSVVREPWTSGVDHDESRALELLEWADIVICEWCLGNAVWYSERVGPDQRLFVRFHRYELDRPFAPNLTIDSVERVVFAAEHIRSEATARFGWPVEVTDVIPNGVDTVSFSRPKSETASTTLGMIGYVPRLKRLDLALDLLEAVREVDLRYRLRIKGHAPEELPWVWNDLEERAFFEQQMSRIGSPGLAEAVEVDPFGRDLPDWARDVGFILSPSDVESFHIGLAEGMASGAVPVVWSRPGVSALWPESAIHSTVEAAARAVLAAGPDLAGAGSQARAWVLDRYEDAGVAARWLALLDDHR